MTDDQVEAVLDIFRARFPDVDIVVHDEPEIAAEIRQELRQVTT